MKRAGLGIAVAILSALVLAASASAATITVSSNLDDGTGCTLREAIESANDEMPVGGCTAGSGGDTIQFASSVTGEIVLGASGPLVIDGMGSLEIQGPGVSTLAIDGNGATGVFEVDDDEDAAITGLTIKEGLAGQGGGIYNEGDLTLERVTVTDNSAVGQDLTVGPTTFAVVQGGGVFNATGSSLTVAESTISDNLVQVTAANGTVFNTAIGQGGGIFAGSGSALSVRRSTIEGNSVTASATGTGASDSAHGAGVYALTTTGSTISLSTIHGNAGSTVSFPGGASGGGVFGDSGLSLTSDTVTGNLSLGPGSNLFSSTTMPGMTIQNTIVADPEPTSTNCNSQIDSLGHNVTAHTVADASCDYTPASGDIQLVGPAPLLALGDYGGPTQTRPPAPPTLLTDPTAIDKGVAASQATDQRGLTRTVQFNVTDGVGGDGTDIGAVEIQAAQPLATNPASPGHLEQALITGSGDLAAFVRAYANADCSAPHFNENLASVFASPGFLAPPTLPDSLNMYSARTVHGAALSSCSTTPLTYIRRPDAPTLDSVSPPSGSNDNTPTFFGTAPAGTMVNIYTEPEALGGCLGTPAGSGTEAEFSGTGIEISTPIPDNSSTRFYAEVVGTHASSLCSGALTYDEVTPPSPPGPTTPASTTPPATTTVTTTTKKKCKKGRKLKRGKCVKKKRKK